MTKGSRKITEEQAEVIHGIKDEFGNRLAEFVELLELAFNIDVNSIVIKRNREGILLLKGICLLMLGALTILLNKEGK